MWKQHSRRKSRHHTSTAGSSLSSGSDAALDSDMSSSCMLNSTGHSAKCRSANIGVLHVVCLLFSFYIKHDFSGIKMKLSAWTGVLFVLLFQQTFWSFVSSTEECGPGERCSTSESCAFCEDCEDGKYTSAFHTSHECHDCNYGEFSSTLNGTNCVCVPGAARYHLEVNSTWGWSDFYNCSQCAPGSSQGKHKIWSQSACEYCLPGTYVDIIGAITCLDCPVGTFTSSSGATTCDTCLSGTVPRPTRDACDACPAGTFGKPNAATCTACPDGFFSDTNASTTCQRCTPALFHRQTATPATPARPAPLARPTLPPARHAPTASFRTRMPRPPASAAHPALFHRQTATPATPARPGPLARPTLPPAPGARSARTRPAPTPQAASPARPAWSRSPRVPAAPTACVAHISTLSRAETARHNTTSPPTIKTFACRARVPQR